VRDFDRFFAAEYRGVVRSLTLALGDQGRAEDAAQDAFASAYQRWRRVRTMDRPGTWVYVVALRAERRRMAKSADPRESEAVVLTDQSADPLDGVWIAQALGALTPRQRLAVVLRYYADLSVDDVAEAMGCAPGTVKATVHVALRRLRVELREEEVADAN
jgi:RNA polymerase sigma factor (sigma-70 family)